MSEAWFTEVKDVVYSTVEDIPDVGTLYSIQRAGTAHTACDWKRLWQLIADTTECATQDVIVHTETTEVEAVIIHAVVKAVTDKFIEQYFAPQSNPPKIKINSTPDTTLGYVIIAGKSEDERSQTASKIFTGEMKGIHQFHRSQFSGTLTVPVYAPKGVKISLGLPTGFSSGARCIFYWRWTVDAGGVKNRPEQVYATLKIEPGSPTKFGLVDRRGAGWEGYDIEGSILSEDLIRASVKWQDKRFDVDFRRY